MENDLPESMDKNNNISASLSLTEVTNKIRTGNASNNMVLEKDNSSVMVAVQETDWDDKVIPETRTSWTTANNHVIWSTGDRIGVYIRSASGGSSFFDQSNVQYNLVSGGNSLGTLAPVSTPIYFPNRVTNAQFFAYYPYSSSAGNTLSVNYTLPTDQTAQTSLSAADLMCSTTPITNGASPNVALSFSHQMVLLSFKINTSLLSGNLTKVSVGGTKVTNTGTLNLSTATVTPNTGSTFSPSVTVNQTIGINTYAYVDIIINPCSLTNNSSMSELKVTLTFGLLSHYTGLITSGSFVGGRRYNYNLTVTLSV